MSQGMAADKVCQRLSGLCWRADDGAVVVKSPLWFSAKYQFTGLALMLLVLVWVDDSVALSFALGGLLYIVPNLYFVHYAFRYQGAERAPLIARSFNWGESGKFALAATGFVAVYRFVEPLRDLALFAGFTTMIVIQWWVATRLVELRDRPEVD